MKLNREMKEKILNLSELGLSVRQIEDVLKIPKSTVHDFISGKTHGDFLPKRTESVRVLALGDMHCGHAAGLTPPDRWYSDTDVYGTDYMDYAKIQRNLWEWYMATLKEIGHVDVLIVNGDTIDGKGNRSGGTELLTTDLVDQTRIAIECLNHISCDRMLMTYGTPYHTSNGGEDFEALIAEHFNAPIEDQIFADINGVIFDVKHKVGGSSVPHGRSTALAKEKLWNRMWAEKEAQPKSDILLRSHVHYYQYCGDSDGVNMILPAMQAPKTKFGGRQCSGTVDVGMVVFDIGEDKQYTSQVHLMPMDFAMPPVYYINNND